MASFLRRVADYIDDSTALTFGTDLFIAQQPDSGTVRDCVTLLDTSGAPPTMEAQKVPAFPAVECISRAESYETALANCQAVYGALHAIVAVEFGDVSLGKTFVFTCAAQDEPKSVGIDGNGHHEALCVFQFQTR